MIKMKKKQFKHVTLIALLFVVAVIGTFMGYSFILFNCTLSSKSIPYSDFQSVLDEVVVESNSKLVLNKNRMIDWESIQFCLRCNIKLTRYLEKSNVRYQRNDYEVTYHLVSKEDNTEVRIQIVGGAVCAVNITSLNPSAVPNNINRMLLSKLPGYLDISATL